MFADTLAHYRSPDRRPDAIRFAHFGSYEDYELWRDIIDAFEDAHPGLRVRQEYVPGWYGRYDAKIRQQILSGTLPDVALMQFGPFTGLSRHFARLDSLIDAEVAADLDASALQSFTVTTETHSELRGMPLAGGNLLIYCNTECLSLASTFHGRAIDLPDDDWTMEDFAALARDLTCDFDSDGALDQFGFWRPGWVYYLPFVWSFGATLVDQDAARWTLQGPEAEAAMTFYRDPGRGRRVCPEPAEVPQLIQDVGFLTGKVAMCVNGPWFQPFLAGTRLRETYAVLNIPRGPGGRRTRVTWDGLCIPAALPLDRDHAAWKFVRFCVTPGVQEMIASTGRSLPARRSALPAFAGSEDDPRRARFIDALSYSRLQPRVPNFDRIDRAMGRHLQRWIATQPAAEPARFLAELASSPEVARCFGERAGHDPASRSGIGE